MISKLKWRHQSEVNDIIGISIADYEHIKDVVYLEPSRTSTRGIFCKYNELLKDSLFSQKHSILDVLEGSKYASIRWIKLVVLLYSRKMQMTGNEVVFKFNPFSDFLSGDIDREKLPEIDWL